MTTLSTRTTALGAHTVDFLDGLETDGIDVLVLDTSAQEADPLNCWLLEPTDRVFEELRRLLSDGDVDPIMALFLDPPEPSADHDAPVAEAAFASLQAVVQSLGIEYPRTRATVVRARRDQAVAIRDLATFLASPAGGYVSVTTIDLRSAS